MDCFNGAATSLSRIAASLWGIEMNYPTLQWGRDIAVADRREPVGPLLATALLQWGRDIAVADRRAAVDGTDASDIASMGPRHRCRGSSLRDTSRRRRRGCFNGAATSLSRIELAPSGLLRVLVASMGPRHRCRGSLQKRLHGLYAVASFNGAATSLSRIGWYEYIDAPRDLPLQWGRDIAVADRPFAPAFFATA